MGYGMWHMLTNGDTEAAMRLAAAEELLKANQNNEQQQNNNQQEFYQRQVYYGGHTTAYRQHLDERFSHFKERPTVTIKKNINGIFISTDAMPNTDDMFIALTRIKSAANFNISQASCFVDGKPQQVQGFDSKQLKIKLEEQEFVVVEEEISDEEFQRLVYKNKSFWQKIFHR